jgi:hypothetical protein
MRTRIKVNIIYNVWIQDGIKFRITFLRFKTLETSVYRSDDTLNLNILLLYSITTFPWLINSSINCSFDKWMIIRSIYFSVSVPIITVFLFSYLNNFRGKILEITLIPLKGVFILVISWIPITGITKNGWISSSHYPIVTL